MAGNPTEKSNSVQNKLADIHKQRTLAENTQTPQENTQFGEARTPDFTRNNEIRQLTVCLVAFTVGIAGITLLVLRENLAMLISGIAFFSVSVLSVMFAAMWRCYDVKRFASIGTEYTVTQQTNSDVDGADQEQGDQTSV